MSYFMNPGGVNQISSFRSENLPCNWRPEAHNEESSPVSGACLCLLKKLWDLSRSSPLCQHDKLSFQASRWPFVCDDLLIFFSPPLAWLFILLLIAVVLPSSSPGEKVGRTAAASEELKKPKKTPKEPEKERKVGGWAGRRSFPLLTACCTVDSSSLKKNLFEKSFQLLFSSVINILRISKWRDSHMGVTRNTQAKKGQTLNYYEASIPCSKKA